MSIKMVLRYLLSISVLILLIDSPCALGGEARPGEIIVKYRSGVTDTVKQEILRKSSAVKVRHFDDLRMKVLKVSRPVEEVIAELQQDPSVEYAEPNYIVRAQVTPQDPFFAEQWALNRIEAPAAWENFTGTSSVVVVIDTGIDDQHPDLKQNLWINQAEATGMTGIDDDGNGVIDDIHGYNAVANNGKPFDDAGHGTHVAGIIGAAGNNNLGIAGINWHVKIMACKFLAANGEGSIADAIECLSYVKKMSLRGVNIVAINNSWGGTNYSQALADTISNLEEIPFIVAAGNDASDNDLIPFYPANYQLPNIIAVAASTVQESLADYSNYGRKSVHVVAPGSGIISTIPNGLYTSMSGTSMATPHVSGLAALLKEAHPELGVSGLKNLLLSAGDPVKDFTPYTVSGRRINAFKSLNCVDSNLFSIIDSPTTLDVGVQVVLSVLSVSCANPVGPVTVTLSGGETLILHDNGVTPDQVAEDGVFTTKFVSMRVPETFSFSSPVGDAVAQAYAPLSIQVGPLTTAFIGENYQSAVVGRGGEEPYLWRVTGLPPGIVFNAGAMRLEGTPLVAGRYNVRIVLEDALGQLVWTTAGLNVTDSFAITTTGIRDGLMQRSYQSAVEVSGGKPPYAWRISQGKLPYGLTLNRLTGIIKGVPWYKGVSNFVVEVTDEVKTRRSKAYALTINVPRADLQIGSLDLSAGLDRGISAVAGILMNNQGDAAANNFSIKVYLSRDQSSLVDAVKIGGSAVTTALRAGNNRLKNISLKVPLAMEPGTWYVLAKIDSTNVVREMNENNNFSPASQVEINPQHSSAETDNRQ